MSVEPPSYAKLTVDPNVEHIALDIFSFTGVLRDPLVGVPHRMTVIRLPNTNELVVYSPIDPSMVDLSPFGIVKAIIAPNRIHYFYVHRFKAAHPSAKLYTSAAIRDRFPDKEWGVILDESTPEHIISPDLKVKCITTCHYLQEVIVVHITSGTMICADLAFNVTPKLLRRTPFGAQVFFKVAGPPRPLDIHALVRSWIRSSCKEMIPQLKEVLEWDWDCVVPAHGEVVLKGGKEAFRQGTFRFVCDTAEGKVDQLSLQWKLFVVGFAGLISAMVFAIIRQGTRA